MCGPIANTLWLTIPASTLHCLHTLYKNACFINSARAFDNTQAKWSHHCDMRNEKSSWIVTCICKMHRLSEKTALANWIITVQCLYYAAWIFCYRNTHNTVHLMPCPTGDFLPYITLTFRSLFVLLFGMPSLHRFSFLMIFLSCRILKWRTVHMYGQCFTPSLGEPPEVWHLSWIQLSLKYLNSVKGLSLRGKTLHEIIQGQTFAINELDLWGHRIVHWPN